MRFLVFLVALMFISGICVADWQWIYSDDTCSVYADFSSMRTWTKPEGSCIDINLKTNLTQKGVEEVLFGREASAQDNDTRWQQLSHIISRQLFLIGARKSQMMQIQYITSNNDIISTKRWDYTPNRWQALRNIERSQKVYDIIMKSSSK